MKTFLKLETSRSKELVAGVCALLFLLVLGYSNVIFLGESLVASANYHPFDNRSDRLRPTAVEHPPFLNWNDLGGVWWMWEPAAAFFSEAYRSGTLPVWDPTIAGGTDSHVNVTQGQYFPPYVLLLLAGNSPLLRDLYLLLLLFSSAVALFVLMWRNGIHPVGAITSAAIFGFSGFMTQNVNSIVGQSAAMLPIMLLAVDWLLERPTYRAVAWTSVVIACCVLSSFLPVVISGYVAVAIHAVALVAVKSTGQPRENRVKAIVRPVTLFTIAMVLSLALAAFLLYPVHSVSKSDPQFDTWYKDIGVQAYTWDYFPTIVSPSIGYGVNRPVPPISKPLAWSSQLYYVGFLPIVLSFLSFTWSDPARRKLWISMSAITIVVFLKLMGVPLIQLWGRLPVFNSLHFVPYFCAVLTIGISGLAGLAVDKIATRKTSLTSTACFAVVSGLLLLALYQFGARQQVDQSPNYREWLLEFGSMAATAVLAVCILMFSGRGRLITPRRAAILMLLIVAAELIPFTYYRRFKRADVWANVPEYVAFLQSDRSLFRFHSNSDLAMTPNVFQGVGLSGISSRHAFTSKRSAELIRRYFNPAPLLYPLATSLLPSSRVVLDIMNVKYVVKASPSKSDIQTLERAGLVLVNIDGEFYTYENPKCWPRAYLATRFIERKSEFEAINFLGSLRSPTEVIVERLPSIPQVNSAHQGKVSIESYSYDRVEVRTHSSKPAVLVLSDSFAPGWRATVNGAAAPIFPVNYAYRGVEVPYGETLVVFRYRTPGLVAGLTISALGLLIVFLLLIVDFRTRSSGAE